MSAAVAGGADDDVGVAVAVHIPRPGHGPAEDIARRLAGGGEGGAGAQPARAAVVDVGPACVADVAVSADDDVGVAVAVHIPRPGHGTAEDIVRPPRRWR